MNSKEMRIFSLNSQITFITLNYQVRRLGLFIRAKLTCFGLIFYSIQHDTRFSRYTGGTQINTGDIYPWCAAVHGSYEGLFGMSGWALFGRSREPRRLSL